jgi:hypothetical protein
MGLHLRAHELAHEHSQRHYGRGHVIAAVDSHFVVKGLPESPLLGAQFCSDVVGVECADSEREFSGESEAGVAPEFPSISA